jgi:hypothetical protein
MTDRDDDIESAARLVRADPGKIADEKRDAVVPGVDPDRKVVREAFDKIKAAREQAARRNG